MEEIDMIRFNRRYNSMKIRSDNLNIPMLITKNDLLNILKLSMNDGFKCKYCEKLLVQISSDPQIKDVYSFDHKIPLTEGGTNDPQNIHVVCHECNIIKGTMTDGTFTDDFIKNLPKENRLRIFNGMFRSRKANKIARNKKEILNKRKYQQCLPI